MWTLQASYTFLSLSFMFSSINWKKWRIFGECNRSVYSISNPHQMHCQWWVFDALGLLFTTTVILKFCPQFRCHERALPPLIYLNLLAIWWGLDKDTSTKFATSEYSKCLHYMTFYRFFEDLACITWLSIASSRIWHSVTLCERASIPFLFSYCNSAILVRFKIYRLRSML